MLDVIHNSFLKKAEWLYHNIFVWNTVLAVGVGLNFYSVSTEKQPKSWLAERSFIMLDVIYKNFWRKD